MLSKDERISKVKFRNIGYPISTISLKYIIAKVYRENGQNISKFTVTVSKKVEKSAVLRNKIRRTAYRSIKENLKSIKNYYNIHIIFQSKPKNFSVDVSDEIKTMITKINDLIS